MRTILPRLRNLLAMLAAESDPLPVKEVADRLRVSRRTVFRELANVDSVLGQYGLEIGSKPGEGILLAGSKNARSSLIRDLEEMGGHEPADKDERQSKLILAIIRQQGQKLATHAERLNVSAPTISHDLDDIEPWISERGLVLTRKTGSGLIIQGDEMKLRRAVLAILQRRHDRNSVPGGYPHPDILLDLMDLSPETDPLLGWMAPQSQEALTGYMAVMTQRIMDGNSLTESEAGPENLFPVAEQLATLVHETFNIEVNPHEIAALTIELAACRPGTAAGIPGKDDDDNDLDSLAADIVSRFDPLQAHILMMDTTLMKGLTAHLRSAVVRVKHEIELVDPMREQIAAAYPDIMNRCRTACEALAKYGDRIPDDEASLLAAHFGASVLRLSEQGFRQRAVRVGVICVHGVGSSYLLASQVKRAFGSRVLAEVGWLDDVDKRNQYELLVSTVEIPGATAPVILVQPILTEDDIQHIEAQLSKVTPETASGDISSPNFLGDLRRLEDLAADVRKVIERFTVIQAQSDCTFDEVAALAGDSLGKTEKHAALICRGLIDREKLSSQVIPELRITLLHCRTDGVTEPVFAVIAPEGGQFTSPHFEGSLSAAVVLLPGSAAGDRAEMMGCLSAALIEQEYFLKAVQSGREEETRVGLERILGEFIFQYSVKKLKG